MDRIMKILEILSEKISDCKRRLNMANNQNEKAWMFFNCDSDFNWRSMNPKYNHVIYRKREGRRALWKKIKSEAEAGRIELDESCMTEARYTILEGNPVDANTYINYGHILEMDVNLNE